MKEVKKYKVVKDENGEIVTAIAITGTDSPWGLDVIINAPVEEEVDEATFKKEQKKLKDKKPKPSQSQ